MTREGWVALFARASRGFRELSAPAIFVGSFFTLIVVGTVGLYFLPGMFAGPRLTFVDVMFTMTSAVCVTGLIIADTATQLTVWGQLWILVFIQLGGLGLITLTSLILGATGHRVSLRSHIAVTPVPGSAGTGSEFWRLAWAVTRFTLAVEAIGALLLFAAWAPHLPMGHAIWHALFHSISAFCNAGFSTFSDSLVGWQRSPFVLLIVSALVIIGGTGFFAIHDVRAWWTANRYRGERRRLSSHTATVLLATAILLVAGTVFFTACEWNGVLAHLTPLDRLTNAWFMSVTPRTAGFNTVDYRSLGNDAAFGTIMLMFVGGAPGSTAGGVKVTTMAILAALAWSRLRGRQFLILNRRGVPHDTVERAISLTLLGVATLTAAVLLLNAVHQAGTTVASARPEFLPIAFEAVSALSTVGLSMGMTNQLGDSGKVVLVVLMFVGRVGLFSFFAAMTLRRSRIRTRLRPAEEDLLIG